MSTQHKPSSYQSDFSSRLPRYVDRGITPISDSADEPSWEQQLREPKWAPLQKRVGPLTVPEPAAPLSTEHGLTERRAGRDKTVAGKFLRRANRTRWVRSEDGRYNVAS